MDSKENFLKQIIISSISIAVFAAIIFFLSVDIKSRTEKFVSMQNKINSSSNAIGLLATLQTDSEEVKKYLPQMANYLTSKDQLINFQKEINSMAQQNNLNFNVGFGQEISPTAVSARETGISLVSHTGASLDNFVNFLTLLENSKYFVRLDNLDAVQEAGQLKLNLRGEVYSF